jgi:hypothetical protein
MFWILNITALDGTGVQHPVIMLSCMAILLAAAKGGLGRGGSTDNDNNDDNDCGKFKSDNDWNAAAAMMEMLPDFRWRVLDVSTEDIVSTMDALLGVCAWKGLENTSRMRCF